MGPNCTGPDHSRLHNSGHFKHPDFYSGQKCVHISSFTLFRILVKAFKIIILFVYSVYEGIVLLYLSNVLKRQTGNIDYFFLQNIILIITRLNNYHKIIFAGCIICLYKACFCSVFYFLKQIIKVSCFIYNQHNRPLPFASIVYVFDFSFPLYCNV